MNATRIGPTGGPLTAMLALLLASCGDSGGPAAPPGPAAVALVAVSPHSATLTAGDTLRLVATTRDSMGTTLTGRTITWSSSDPAVGSVSSSGTVTAVVAGSVTITASSEGKHADAQITVLLPPASTVTVSPDAATIFVGDSVTLTATARDAGGAVIQGKVAHWTSSAPAVASVSAAGVVTALAPGNTVVNAQLDAFVVSAQIEVQPVVVLDVAHQASLTFDKAGGTLTTTTGSGATLTLVVPKDAVGATPLQITMTPVLALKGLPSDADLLSAVKFEPSGTTFARPLTLRIAGASSAASGKVLVGFTASDTAGDVSLLPARVVSGDVEVVVPHFSLIGAGAVFPEELADLDHPPAGGGAEGSTLSRLDLILTMPTLTPDERLQFTSDELFQWIQRVAAVAAQASQGDQQMADAIRDYAFWESTVAWMAEQLGQVPDYFLQQTGILNYNGSARTDLVIGLQDAIHRANAACLLVKDLHQIRAVLFWQDQAEELGLTSGSALAADLQRPNVIANLCASVVLTEADFPVGLTAGQGDLVHLRWGVRFTDDPVVVNMAVPYDFQVTGESPIGSARGTSAPDGTFDLLVLPTGGVDLVLQGVACLPPEQVDVTDLCTPFSAQQFVPAVISFTGALPDGTVGTAYSSTVQATGGTGTFQFTLASGTLPPGLMLNPSSASATVSGTPTTGGTYTFTLRVTSGTQHVDRSFTVTVTGLLATGAWEDDAFVWHWSIGGPGSNQPRGLRFEIYRDAGGNTRARAWQPPYVPGSAASLFDIAIQSANGQDFSGSEALPITQSGLYFFDGWTVTVSGTVLANGMLDLHWRCDLFGQFPQFMTADGTLPPG